MIRLTHQSKQQQQQQQHQQQQQEDQQNQQNQHQRQRHNQQKTKPNQQPSATPRHVFQRLSGCACAPCLPRRCNPSKLDPTSHGSPPCPCQVQANNYHIGYIFCEYIYIIYIYIYYCVILLCISNCDIMLCQAVRDSSWNFGIWDSLHQALLHDFMTNHLDDNNGVHHRNGGFPTPTYM